MEYPFKDLMPLDEVLEREGYYKDWTHLDPEVFYSLTQISNFIKTKGYGVDVRLLIAQLAEHFGLKTTQVVDLANLLQQKFTNLEGVTQSFTNNINSLVAQMEADKNTIVANATVDSEVILARGGKPTLQARLDDTATQLAETNNKIKITPDDFDGSDVEKIQQALDFAILNNVDVIHLNRLYDITGGTIYMPTESFWGFLTFEGGHIRKDDAGFIFNRNVSDSNKSCNSPMFINTKFSSESDGVYLYNGNRMIRHNLTNCIFHKVGLAKSDTYLQSVRLLNCETGQLGTHFVDSKMAYDFSFDNHRAESSSSPDYHLIKVVTDKANDISYFGLRITSSVIEGYSKINPISIGTGYGLKVDGTYFEANNGDIKIAKGVGGARTQGSISNCVIGGNLSTYILDIETGVNVNLLSVENNTSNITVGQYFSNRDVFKGGKTNNLYGGGGLTSAVSTIKKDVGFPYNHLNLGVDGVSFEIPLINLLKVGGNLHDVDEKQFLVNFKFTFGTSVWYSAHLTGILSVDGFLTDGVVKQGLLFTKISERNTAGNANGSTSAEPLYEYYFKESNSKFANSTGTPNLTVVFKFPKGVYTAKNHASFIPIRGILGEYTAS